MSLQIDRCHMAMARVRNSLEDSISRSGHGSSRQHDACPLVWLLSGRAALFQGLPGANFVGGWLRQHIVARIACVTAGVCLWQVRRCNQGLSHEVAVYYAELAGAFGDLLADLHNGQQVRLQNQMPDNHIDSVLTVHGAAKMLTALHAARGAGQLLSCLAYMMRSRRVLLLQRL